MVFSESLKDNRDFKVVYRTGKSYANKYLVMIVRKNDIISKNNQKVNRLGISISKKVGNSVVRHHFCRIVREIYRLHENMFNSGLDIVVIARNSAKNCSYHEIESAFLHLSKLHHIMNEHEE